MNTLTRTLTLHASVFCLCTSSFAQPGSGIRLSPNSSLTPGLTSTINYDDNISLRRRALSQGTEGLSDGDSDTYFGNTVSLRFTHLRDETQFNVYSWYGREDYQDISELDNDRYGASFGVVKSFPNGRTVLEADASFQHATDFSENLRGIEILDEEGLENISERVERDIIRLNFAINQQLTTSIGSALIFVYDDTDYKVDNFNDRTNTEYILELNHRLSPKTQPYVRVGIAREDDDGFDGTNDKPFVLGGVRHSPTDKLRFDVAAGYEQYNRTPLVREPNFEEQRFDMVPGEKIEDESLRWSLRLNYAATRKSSFSLTGRTSTSALGTESSARETVSLAASMRHITTDRVTQSVLVSWREDDYLSPITVGDTEIDEVKETLVYQYQVDYQTVRPWLELFARVKFEDGSSKLPDEDYTQTTALLGASLRY